MIRMFLAVCWLLINLPLASQEVLPAGGEGAFLTVGIGIPVHTVRDKINSPLAYRGRGVDIRLGFERVRENWLSQVRLAFSTAKLRARVKPRRDMNKSVALLGLRFSVGLYRNLSSAATASGSAQYAGLSLAAHADNRSYPLPTNNTNGSHYRLSTRLGLLDRRGLGSGTRWAVTSQLEVPLLTKLYRPTYIGLTPFLHQPRAKRGAYWKSMAWKGPGGFLGTEARFAVDYLAQPWRSDRLEYAFWLGYTPEPQPKSLLFTAGQLSYAYRARL